MYAFVALKYLVPMERILKTVEAHRAYLRELKEQGRLVCSGPFVPREGGGLLLRIDGPEEIQPLLARHPPHTENLVADTIYVWDPNIGRDDIDQISRRP